LEKKLKKLTKNDNSRLDTNKLYKCSYNDVTYQ